MGLHAYVEIDGQIISLWRAPYSTFDTWRNVVASALSWDGLSVVNMKAEPLLVLLTHSDCDGFLYHEDCAAMADRLEKLLFQIRSSQGLLRHYTVQFINGLREAAHAECDVEFA